VRQYGIDGSNVYTENKSYYDGQDFIGLSEGQLTTGLITRTTAKISADSNETTNVIRNAYDSNGNIVEIKDANNHSTRFEYDENGLLMMAEEKVFNDPNHEPYTLRMEVEYHPLYNQISSSTNWMRFVDGSIQSQRHETKYAYDIFGRISAITKPGNTLSAPTNEFEYELAEPVSRIIAKSRSKVGQLPDLEAVQCFDGMGRKLQTKTKTKEGEYLVSGFSAFNIQGKTNRVYQAYTSSTSTCDLSAQQNILYTEAIYDAAGRVLETTIPDESIYGSRSVQSSVYGPLFTMSYDSEDNDSSSNHFDTPTTIFNDGAGRKTRIERLLEKTGTPILTGFTFDELGRVRSHIDDHGNEKTQNYDLLGRTLQIDDPDTGVTTFGYDEAGNRLWKTDSRNTTVNYTYDEANRPVSQWDDSNPNETLVEFFYDQYEDCDSEKCTNLAGMLAAIEYPVGDGTRGTDMSGFDYRGQGIYSARQVAGHLFESTISLDNAGRASSIKLPDGRNISSTLDSMGRVTNIPGYVDSVNYNSKGLMSSFDLANGTKTKQNYDDVQRLNSLITTGSDNSLLQSYHYELDRAGNILNIDDQRPLEVQPSETANYVYDSLYRLTDARLDTSQTTPEQLTYKFDTIDNILEKTSSLEILSPAHVGIYEYAQNAGPHAVTKA